MTIKLDFDTPFAECGGRFTGWVNRDADADGVGSQSRARSVRLTLCYRTEGRGDTDSKEVSSTQFDLAPHGGLSAAFALPVPLAGPVSYDGTLMRVLYEIEARVDIKLARDPKVKWPVLVIPEGGDGAYDRPHPLPVRPNDH